MIRLISKYRSFQSKASGGTLFEQVCKQLNLLETDYFGLEYNDNRGATVSPIYYRKKKDTILWMETNSENCWSFWGSVLILIFPLL